MLEGRRLLYCSLLGTLLVLRTGSALTYPYPRVVTLPPSVELPGSIFALDVSWVMRNSLTNTLHMGISEPKQ